MGLVSPGSASARATVRLAYVGDGVMGGPAVSPVGGNAARSLGEQRRLALEYAAEVWGARLDSDVPIVVEVEFTPLPCDASASVLGAAATTALFSGITANGADPAVLYPSALANRLAGRDLDPSEPEIRMQLNSDVDAACRQGSGGFYYGFDRQGDGIDFVETVLHELAHGLGLASFADPETGALFMNAVDPYTAQVRDLELDRTWPELDDAGRAASARRLRRVAWDGRRAREAVEMQFAKGTPSLTFEPAVAGWSGVVSDTSFGRNPALAPASGPVLPANGCEALPGAVMGGIPLLRPTSCSPALAAQRAREAGAVAALLVGSSPFIGPALPEELAAGMVELPLATVSSADADRIERALAAGALRARLGGRAEQPLGADADDRPLLFASEPVNPSSSISHLEPLIRPQQMMEPITGPIPSHDVTFTLALLADLGWQQRCGDGRIEGDEACDEGAANSDAAPDRCRSDCRRPRCGDGVQDSGEACDADNSDLVPDACRTSCELPRCGDGVVDRGEVCDRGPLNRDEAGYLCRTDCTRPDGDGVQDASEPDAGMRADPGRAERRSSRRMAVRTAAADGGDEEAPADAGCSCRALGARGAGSGGWVTLLFAVSTALRSVRARASRRRARKMQAG